MRVVVTGFSNPYGRAIVEQLLAQDHMVRLFGGTAEDAEPFADRAQWHPGDVRTPGSIEPVLSEREVLVHAACVDAPGRDRRAHAVHIERGTLGCKYGAERELMDQFIHITPKREELGRYKEAQKRAVEIARSSRKVHVHVIDTSGGPETVAKAVLHAVEKGPHWGRYPGRETDAVTP